MKRRRLILRRETVRRLDVALADARGGALPSVAPRPCAEAATDGNNGCASEAGGCHTGWTACGTC